MSPNKKIKLTGLFFLILGIAFLLCYNYPESWFGAKFVKEIYAHFGTESLGISITILFIDYLYELKEAENLMATGIRDRDNLKARLIREFGSVDKAFTARALKELRQEGWLTDGSLKDADLSNADLSGLDLSGANLTGVIMNNAQLVGTNLSRCNLSSVTVKNASLMNANMEFTTLKNAKFIECKMYGARLNNAKIIDTDMLKSNLEMTELRDVTLSNVQFEDAVFSFSKFDRSVAKECQFLRANWSGMVFTQSIFERCDLDSVLNWEKAVNIITANFSGVRNPPIGFLDFINKKV